jgi:PTH1 family peptidyl-tRNA hydrolase
MRLFVGLGNPGAQYAGHRHNIGFLAVDRIAADHGFAPWKRAFKGEVAEGRLGREKVLLLKPQTFMNLSGEAVRAAVDFYKLAPGDVTVFHDELDLAPGKVRLKAGGGHAGHNGLRSVHQHLGPDYGRVRLGIGHPGHKDRVAAYVLSNFGKDEAEWLEDVLRGVSDGAAALAGGEGARFLNAVALRVAPPRSGGGGAGAADGGLRNRAALGEDMLADRQAQARLAFIADERQIGVEEIARARLFARLHQPHDVGHHLGVGKARHGPVGPARHDLRSAPRCAALGEHQSSPNGTVSQHDGRHVDLGLVSAGHRAARDDPRLVRCEQQLDEAWADIETRVDSIADLLD